VHPTTAAGPNHPARPAAAAGTDGPAEPIGQDNPDQVTTHPALDGPATPDHAEHPGHADGAGRAGWRPADEAELAAWEGLPTGTVFLASELGLAPPMRTPPGMWGLLVLTVDMGAADGRPGLFAGRWQPDQPAAWRADGDVVIRLPTTPDPAPTGTAPPPPPPPARPPSAPTPRRTWRGRLARPGPPQRASRTRRRWSC